MGRQFRQAPENGAASTAPVMCPNCHRVDILPDSVTIYAFRNCKDARLSAHHPNTRTFVMRRSLFLAAGTSSLALCAPALVHAQDVESGSADAAAQEPADSIIVTGSRIRRDPLDNPSPVRSEEHTSELPSLMRTSYA